MKKLVFLLAICGALMTLLVQQSAGFAIGSIIIQKGFAASAPASALVSAPASALVSAPASASASAATSTVALPSKNALLQGITNAVSAKLSAVQQLVGQVLQLKQGITQSVLRSVTSASGNGYTKNITITKGIVPAASTTTTTTTATGTAAKSSGYNYGK